MTFSFEEAPVHAHEKAVSEEVPAIVAVPVNGAIDLDGRFDEEVWQRAPIAAGFRQQEPETGEPGTQRTEFQVAFDDRALYFAVRAFDTEPDQIFAREMQRDGALRRDDAVILAIDTFHDHRNSYFLEFNSNGAQTDALITDEGRDRNFEWDGIWSVSARVTEDGWVAEVEIPFRTLRFDSAGDRWGLNVSRSVRRRNERTYWSYLDLDASIFRASRFGHLDGLPQLEKSANIQVTPYLIGSTLDEATPDADSDEGDDFDAGLDLKWGITRNLALDLTVNTDFAETESDNLEVNLTRFSLFFPEKREFFLENAGIFRFGPGAPNLGLFFSRRIGIGPLGEVVPVAWGARLTGRVGEWSLGLLDAQTSETDGEEGVIPEINWGVVRAKRNLGRRSNVGFMMTHASPERQDEGLSFGVDAEVKPTDNLELAAFWAATEGWVEGESEEQPFDSAYGVSAEWEAAPWEVEFGFREIGEDFEPAIGFVRRGASRTYSGEFVFEPRVAAPRIRQYEYELAADWVTRLDNTLESLELEFRPFGIRFESGDGFRLLVAHAEEDLVDPFEIRPGVILPVGRYEFTSFGIEAQSESSRPVSVNGRAMIGEFFDGNRLTWNVNVGYRPSRYLGFETFWSHNDVELVNGDFVTDLWRQRILVTLNPDLLISLFGQYDKASELLALNARLRWIYRPGSDLFVVYNQNWDAPSLGSLRSGDREITVKWTYRFEF